jgi:hypothetical protein
MVDHNSIDPAELEDSEFRYPPGCLSSDQRHILRPRLATND